MLKRLHHTGSTLRSRSVADKGAIARAVEDEVLPLMSAGKVRPVIFKTFPFARPAAAHALMEIERPYRQDRADALMMRRQLSSGEPRGAGDGTPRNRHNVERKVSKVGLVDRVIDERGQTGRSTRTPLRSGDMYWLRSGSGKVAAG